MGDLTKDFSRKEFACKCGCGLQDPAPALVLLLQKIREGAESPITIISGWRCTLHNKNEKSTILGKQGFFRGQRGDVNASAHTRGEAADITAKGKTKHQLYDLIIILWQGGKLPELQYCYIIKNSAASVHVGVDKKKRNDVFGGER